MLTQAVVLLVCWSVRLAEQLAENFPDRVYLFNEDMKTLLQNDKISKMFSIQEECDEL